MQDAQADRVAQLAQRFGLNLANALAGKLKLFANLFQGVNASIIDTETKLIVSLVVGRRTGDAVVQVFTDYYERTDGFLPQIIMTDEYAVYETVILGIYGVWRDELGLTPQEEAEFQRNGMPEFYFPVEITYATVHKTRRKNRVVQVEARVVYGTKKAVKQALKESAVSEAVVMLALA